MITVANLLSGDLDGIARGVRSQLRVSLGEEVDLAASATLADFRDGRVGIALLCGLAYSLIRDAAPGRFTVVAAPVVDDPRSGGAAVYFSELVVPASSAARRLEDLAGARFARNERISFSGWRALEHKLLERGLSADHFAERIPTGSHSASLECIKQGRADAAAIDSHVLLLAKRRDPALAGGIRVIETLGPYPAPPVAVNTSACDVSPALLYELLTALPPATLRGAAVRGWQPVDDARYDRIRTVTRDLPGLGLPR